MTKSEVDILEMSRGTCTVKRGGVQRTYMSMGRTLWEEPRKEVTEEFKVLSQIYSERDFKEGTDETHSVKG